MSTKVAEACPRCGTSTMPTDKALVVNIQGADVPCKMWRYECEAPDCGHSWSNPKQRDHNALAYKAARRLVHDGYFG